MNSNSNTQDREELGASSNSPRGEQPTSTTGTSTMVTKAPTRLGWKSVLVRQCTFDQLQSLRKAQDKTKKPLELADLSDGLIGYVIADAARSEAGIAEGRRRKREQFLALAQEWAD